jgi:ABC-type polysaccharide/polyol phosphate transport system ATPase subunit
MALVELNNISKCYNIYERPADRLKEIVWRNRRCFHREYWALRDLNLHIEAGQSTAILGANGSGKSTLLQIIAGVVQPTTGTVAVNGRLTAILELGAGFQPEYSGRENVLLGGMILGVPRDEMLAKMDEIAEFAEIGEFFDQPVKTYSSGMLVRLAFGACINVDPDILLIDEALAVGDVRFQHKCINKIHKLQAAGKTIIFVSHDMTLVKQFCKKAILLDSGRVLAQGDVPDVAPQYDEIMQTGSTAPKHFSAPTVTVR